MKPTAYIGILIVILVLGATFFISQRGNNTFLASSEQTREEGDPSTSAHRQGENSTSLHYFTKNEQGDEGTTTVRFYRVNDSLAKHDERLSTVKGDYTFMDTLPADNEALFVRGNLVVGINVVTGEQRRFVHASSSRSIDDAAFLGNKTIGYVTSNRKVSGSAKDSRFHTVRLSGERIDDVFLKEESPLYARFGITGSDGVATVYLEEVGGDAAAVWGSDYALNLRTEELEKLTEYSESYAPGFQPNPQREGDTIGQVNPGGTKSAYVANPTYEAENVQDKSDTFGRCLTDVNEGRSKGAAIIVRDLTSGEEREVYRNLSHSENYCRNIVRRVDSLYWISDTHLAFSTPDAVYSINVETKEKETIYNFPDWSDPKTVSQPGIDFVQGDILVMQDNTLVHRATRKVLDYKRVTNEDPHFIDM